MAIVSPAPDIRVAEPDGARRLSARRDVLHGVQVADRATRNALYLRWRRAKRESRGADAKLPGGVVSPTPHLAAVETGADVRVANGDLGSNARQVHAGWRPEVLATVQRVPELTSSVCSPAVDRAAVEKRARIVAAGGHLCDGSNGRETQGSRIE